MAGEGGTINVSRTHSILLLFIMVAGAGATFMATQNGIEKATGDAQRAMIRANEAYAKAETAEALARDKGDKATEALAAVNVKLARIETLVEQLVKDAAETKAVLKERDGREGRTASTPK